MKQMIFAGALMSSLLFSHAVWAEDECVDPVADWKAREMLRRQLEQQGWTIQRIKVDDGCYQVRGVDHHGNKFEAVYAPSSLRILKLKISFSHDGDASNYLDKERRK